VDAVASGSHATWGRRPSGSCGGCTFSTTYLHESAGVAGKRQTKRRNQPLHTASGWNGSFYPRGMKPSDYLRFYAERFHTVEVDSTFYACPTARTVENWNARTPQGFVFSVKVPQMLTWRPSNLQYGLHSKCSEYVFVRPVRTCPRS
jgi:hypothetical protein